MRCGTYTLLLAPKSLIAKHVADHGSLSDHPTSAQLLSDVFGQILVPDDVIIVDAGMIGRSPYCFKDYWLIQVHVPSATYLSECQEK